MKAVKEDIIKEVIANVLGIKSEEINDESSADTIESWDSLKHLKLVLALEEELDVSFTEEQVVEMLNYALIKEIIKENNIEIQ